MEATVCQFSLQATSSWLPRLPPNRSSLPAVDGRANNIATQLGSGTREIYLKVRETARPVTYDRPQDGDIRVVRKIV